MNRSIFLIVFSLFLTTAALGVNTQTVLWGHQLMSETDDVPRAAAVGSEGGIYFAFEKQVKAVVINSTAYDYCMVENQISYQSVCEYKTGNFLLISCVNSFIPEVLKRRQKHLSYKANPSSLATPAKSYPVQPAQFAIELLPFSNEQPFESDILP